MAKQAYITDSEELEKILQESRNAITASGAVIVAVKREMAELERRNRELNRRIRLLL